MSRCLTVPCRNSRGATQSSSCGTGPLAFCAVDASLGGPASHEQPDPPQECGPTARNQQMWKIYSFHQHNSIE